MDTLPAQIQADVRSGRYTGDLTSALRDALETGDDFMIPPGVFHFAGDILEVRKTGQRIVGTGGVLRRLPERDGIGLLISATDVTLHDLKIDGSAPAARPSHSNDTVKVTGDRCTLQRLVVQGSWGSNLRIDRARNCTVIEPQLYKAYQNNLIICNGSTEDILIERPTCIGTVLQNNIFVTASDGSNDNGEIISRVTITDPMCSDAGDTGIELGYHSQDCRVTGGKIVNSTNPAILQRDGLRNRWDGVVVQSKYYHHQHDHYDAVAVVPQWESAAWDSDTEFRSIIALGRVKRSAFFWNQSGIRRIDCTARAFGGLDTAASGALPVGNGDLKAGDVSNIVVRGGRIDGFAVGDNWNYDAKRYERIGCVTEEVEFTGCSLIFSCYNIIPIHSMIVGNKGKGNLRGELLLSASQLVPSDQYPDAGLIYYDNQFTANATQQALITTLPLDGMTMDSPLLAKNSRFVKLSASGNTLISSSAMAGQYMLSSGTRSLAFTLTVGPKGPVVQGTSTLAISTVTTIQVAVENRGLVLHQHGAAPGTLWVKITGPGIQAAHAA
jgi:hypothetical protein